MKRIVYISVLLALVALNGAAQNISGSWSGVLEVEDTRLPFVFNITADGRCTIDSPSEKVRNIPGDVDYLSPDSLCISTSIGFVYSGRLQDGVIHGTFTQNNISVPMDLSPVRRPQTPQFTNANAGATLAGTLSVPEGAKCVLLMVTGSGLENRDEELFGHKPFAVIADRLARQGIATLRYDDRAYGESVGGDVMGATTSDFADDAAAGIEWLRRSGRFQQVGILGHSEGGQPGGPRCAGRQHPAGTVQDRHA